MGGNFVLSQISEGSLIFNRKFGVSVSYVDRGYFEFIYKVYDKGILKWVSKRISDNVYYFMPEQYGIYKVVVEVYSENEKIATIQSPVLDFIEDFVLIKDTHIKYEEGEILVGVETEINPPKENYAYYLKRDKQVIEKIFYTKQSGWHFKVKEPGEYCVQVFVRLIKNNGTEDKVITHTESIKVESIEIGEDIDG